MFDQKIILKNKVKCNICNSVIESINENNKVSCTCGNVSISGGKTFLIREGFNYTELTEYMLNE